MPADPQVVTLRHIVGQHHPGTGADAGQHGQQHPAFQGLRLVHDDERVVQRAPANVGERQYLEHPAFEDLVDDLGGRDGRQCVEHRLRPG